MAKKQDDRKLQITFNPQFSAAEQKTILLIAPDIIGHIPADAVQATAVSGNVRDHHRFNRL